ncbi:hypothetical protein HR060_05395 [Catenovulum sp. SM1970]|uniref:hypothetical protein n=1 Tax=Marinifaba aquimaris TaxID=2741323 RepID=UPI0015747DD4|nr:hypothetical protein [Marinifaba aquimaris]NTS76298.1 hypothetical protein [Marinifaba aquimaris]
MDKLIFLSLVVAGYFGFQTYNSQNATDAQLMSISGKLERNIPVSGNEVLAVANQTLNHLCNDELYQVTGGSSVEQCHKTLSQYQDLCEYKYFPDTSITYASKNTIDKLIANYMRCSNNEPITS